MTRVELDEQTGRLRLDREAFERLVGAASSTASTDELAERARHPRVRAGLAAVVEPVCRLRVILADGERHAEHEGWLTHTTAALLLSSADGMLEFLTVAPEFVPAALARMMRLGPRPVGQRRPVEVDEDTLDGLVDPDPAAREDAFSAVADTGASLGVKVELAWDGPDGEPDGRGLVVLDGRGGLYAFRLEEAAGELVPVDGTFVWTALCALLPDDATLAGWLSGPGGASGGPAGAATR